MRVWAIPLVLCSFVSFAEDDAGSALPQSMVIEDFESAPVDAGAPAGLAIDEFEPTAEPDAGAPLSTLESFEAATSAPTVRFYGWTSGYTSLDTRFDSQRGAALAENVWEGRLRAVLGVDVKVNPHLRLVLEGRGQVRGAFQRDFDRAKGFFEPMLGDAYVDLYTSKVDLRVGQQRIALGANAGLAPIDALNPRDLRETAGDLESALLPVFAVRARGEVGKVQWLAAYVPFFQPHRTFVFGQDEGLLQPAFGTALDNTRIDPSIEDYVQDRVLETQRPPPFAGDLALRLALDGRVKLGVNWVWMNEKLPRVTMDPELSNVLASQAAGKGVDPAGAVSVLNRSQAGETLYRGFYGRQHVFSIDGSALLGPGQLDVDLSFSPRQTFFDQDFRPIDKPAVTWVATYSQASDSIVLYGVSYLGMAIPDIKANEQLVLIEPATAKGSAHTGFLHVFLGFVSVSLWDKRIELGLRASFEVVQRSFSLAPRVAWKGTEGLEVFLSAEFYEGSAWSPFGYFDRNDRVLLGARYELF